MPDLLAHRAPTMKSLLAFGLALLSAPTVLAADTVDYLRDVKPILAKNCASCHGAAKQRSGLRLDTAKAALEGGNAGPAVIPGKSTASRLIQAVTGVKDVVAMPPKGPRLSAGEIALLTLVARSHARLLASATLEPIS